MLKRLLPLSLATFAVGTDGFVIAGLLPAISADLHVSVPAAGQLVTAFALTFAVAAPVLGWATSSFDRRSALLLALTVFVIGNVATAVSADYTAVLLARVLTAIGAGIITSTASSTAAAISPPERRGRSLAFVLGGLSLSTALGLPLGTLIGRDDWHLTLWAVAALGSVAAIGVALGLPRITLPTTTLRARLAPLRQSRVSVVLLVTSLSMAAPYVLYTYIGEATATATGGKPGTLTVVLLIWGIGALTGNLLAGRLVDRFPPSTVVAIALAGLTALLAISPLVIGNLTATTTWALFWGIAVGMPTVAQQQRLITFAPASSPVLLGLNSSAIYLGIAAGGALGGLAQHWLPASTLGLPAAALTLIALPLTLTTRKMPVPTT